MTNLAPALEQRIQRQMELGSYNSSEEVLEDALEVLERRNADFAAFRDELNAKLDESVAAVERGEFITREELELEFDSWSAGLEAR